MNRKTKVIAKFQPLPWQAKPWLDTSPIMLLTGSAGGGKSRLAGEKLHGYCQRYPGAMALMLRKIRQSMTNSTVLFMNRTVISGDPKVRHYPSKLRFEYTNGSILAYGGMANEEQREQVRSIGQEGGIDIVWMEEATGFVEDDFNEVLARMRGQSASWRQIILSTNPDAPKHWINQRLIKGGGAKVYYSSAMDNAHNPPEYLDALGMLTGILALRLREGRWVQAVGVIYDTFDSRIHVVSRDPAEMRYWALAVDEGYTNPAVLLLVGIDNDARVHVMREWYERGKLQEQVVAEALQMQHDLGGHAKVQVVVVDASAAGLVAEMRNAGLSARPHSGRVLDGIAAVQGLLRVQRDGRPRLTIDPSCKETIAEFESYAWKENKDEPMKRDDHAMDAIRYLVDWLFVEEMEVARVRYAPVRVGRW